MFLLNIIVDSREFKDKMKNAIMSFIKRSMEEIFQKHHSGKKKIVFLVSSNVSDGKSRIKEMHVRKKNGVLKERLQVSYLGMSVEGEWRFLLP